MTTGDCVSPLAPKSVRVDYTPFLGWFLDISTGLVKLAARFSDEESIEITIKALMEKSATTHIAWEIFKNNIMIFLIFFLGVFCAILVLIGCIVLFIHRWCSTNTESSKNGNIWIAGAIFVGCAIMAILCIALVVSCATALAIAANKLPYEVNASATNVEVFMSQLQDHIECQFDKELNNMSDYIELAANGVRQDIRNLRSSLASYGKAQQALSRNDLKNKLSALSRSGGTTPKSIKDLIRMVDDMGHPDNLKYDTAQISIGIAVLEKGVAAFGHQRRAINFIFKTMLNDTLNSIFETVGEFIEGLSEKTSKYVETTDFHSYTTSVFVGAIGVPALLLLLCILSLGLLLTRALFNFCVKDPNNGKRGILSRFGGEVMGGTGYVAMFITILLFLMSSCAFLCAFAAVTVCVGFFEDKDLRVFRVTDGIFMENSSVRVSDIFFKCKNEYSFFDAVDGSARMADLELKDKVQLLSVRDAQREIERGVDTYDDQSIYEKFLSENDALFRSGISQSGVDIRLKAEAENSLKNFQGELRQIVDIEHKIDPVLKKFISKDFKDQINKINTKIKTTAENLVTALVDLSPNCVHIMVIWNDIGWYVCNMVATPLSGTWVACLITGFISILIYQAIFDSTKYLKSFDESGSKSKSENPAK